MSTLTPARTIPVAKPLVGMEEEQAVVEVLRSGWLSQGPRVAQFEKEFAAYVGAPHAIAVSNCTTALHLALAAAGVAAGHEVICPSLSFIATANAITYLGACPVFVDIDPRTFNLDPARVEEAITDRTSAILVVHQIGLPADLNALAEIATRRGVALVEDAACAIGAEYHGRRIGGPHGALACFSFHPRKILTTGEGGMITTADADTAARLRKLRQHAMGVSDLARHSANKVMIETYDEIGYNYRMTDLQAAVGLCQLHRLDAMIAQRRRLAERYSERLADVSWLEAPYVPTGYVPNYQSYMVKLSRTAPRTREELMQAMLDRGIATRRAVMASHREAPYVPGHWDAKLPVTNDVAERGLILPLYHAMSDSDQDYVIESLVEAGARR
jgi:dTDP-4-amino-4,6-dideoxygalactose transaminase